MRRNRRAWGVALAGVLASGAAAQPVPAGELATRIELARALDSYGAATQESDALLLAARIWRSVGADEASRRAIAQARGLAPGDRALDARARILLSESDKGPAHAMRIAAIAGGARSVTRVEVEVGPARVRVLGSQWQPVALVVRDRAGIELCRATGLGGDAQCGWTARWPGEVVAEVSNLGPDAISAWTLVRSEDNLSAGGAAEWR